MFRMELPDLNGFIKKLNMYEENTNKALRETMHDVGNNIVNAQRRLISEKSTRVAGAIGSSRIYTTKKGTIGIKTGYMPNAFKTAKDGSNLGVAGMQWEFGRPGQSSQRSKPTMTQVRNGKRVTVNKGSIQPVPHIRPGFDSTLEGNVNLLIGAVNQVTDKLGE